MFLWFGIFALAFYRGATGAYVDDMISAAVAGSQEARNEWIGDVRDSYVEDDGLSLSEAEKQATLDVDAAILERRKESGLSCSKEMDVKQIAKGGRYSKVRKGAETRKGEPGLMIRILMKCIFICLVFGMPWLIKRLKRKKRLRIDG